MAFKMFPHMLGFNDAHKTWSEDRHQWLKMGKDFF